MRVAVGRSWRVGYRWSVVVTNVGSEIDLVPENGWKWVRRADYRRAGTGHWLRGCRVGVGCRRHAE